MDSFEDWEHYFIAVEHIEGMTLEEYTLQNNPFFSQEQAGRRSLIRDYLDKILSIFSQVLEAMEYVHGKGYAIADLSSRNIMITTNGEVRLIDLEACVEIANPPVEILSTMPVEVTDESIESVDYQALSGVFYDAFLPKSKMREFGVDYLKKTLQGIVQDFQLSDEVVHLWEYLFSYNGNSESHLVREIINNIEKAPFRNAKSRFAKLEFSFPTAIIRHMKEPLEHSFFPRTEDELSLAGGWAGAVYQLLLCQGGSVAAEQLMAAYLVRKTSSISLLEGDAGLALALLEDKPGFSMAIVEHLLRKNNIEWIEDCTFGTGLSGFGLLLLKMWKKTQNDFYREQAIKVGQSFLEKLDDCLQMDDIGLVHGATGISYFFLMLYCVTNQTNRLARRR